MANEHGTDPTNTGPAAPIGEQTPPPAAWGAPLAALDRGWTKFEIWLAMVAFSLEVFSMTIWVGLKGFSTPAEHVSSTIFRGIVGGTILGLAAWFATKKQTSKVRQYATSGAVFLGFLLAKTWISVGFEYSSNVLNWYQQASFLTLLGGLRGVGTRLTMLLALVGGSLATGRGRHIVIDVLTRIASHKQRLAMLMTGWIASALVCTIAAWGFFDHISIENFGARADDAPGTKISQVFTRLEEDIFIGRKQLALDFLSAPHVLLKGQAYSEWLTGKEWNTWLEGEGFAERYGKEAAEGLKIPDDETRAPIIILPGRGEPRGELINAAYLVFPVGLLIIALRFILRGLLVLSGHASSESDESEDWNENAPRAGEEPLDAIE